MKLTSRTALAGVASLALLTTAGCEYEGASSLPLPGGVGGDGYEVTMVFDDVTNLVPKETCRAGDVVVGTVASIELREDLKATVVCRIDPDIELAGNAVPTLRETSLLGERFVALDPPAGEPAVGTLEPGAVLRRADSHVVPDVEVVFSALSQVLNGGGLAHIETISRELSTALGEADLGGTTRRLAAFVKTLDTHRGDIVAALESVDRLATSLAEQRDVIAEALDSVPAGLAVLERQRPRLVSTLRQLGDLSDVAVPLIHRTKEGTVADLQHLGPILEQLAASKKRLSKALEGFITFPFPSYTKYVTQGDYAGMYTTVTFDLDSFNHLLAQEQEDGPSIPTQPPGPPPALPDLPELPELPIDELLDLLPGLQAPDSLPGQVGGDTTSTDPPRTLGDLLLGGAS